MYASPLVVAALIVAVGAQVAAGAQEPAKAAEEAKLVRHVVLFKFKADTTPEKVKEIEKAFANLKNEISFIKDFEWGTNVSTENLAQGFTHCFIVTFGSLADRDAYLPHPAHKKFVELAGPHFDKALVVDFVPGQ